MSVSYLSKVYVEKEEKIVGIFDRLEKTKQKSEQPQIKITGLNRMPSTSIFSRLGGKSDDIEMEDEKAVGFAGILKSAPKKVGFIIELINVFEVFISSYFYHIDCEY